MTQELKQALKMASTSIADGKAECQKSVTQNIQTIG